MTPRLSKRQKQLNEIIKLDSSSKCPAYQTYQEMKANGSDVNEFKEYFFDKNTISAAGCLQMWSFLIM
jgi:hypothetical protein